MPGIGDSLLEILGFGPKKPPEPPPPPVKRDPTEGMTVQQKIAYASPEARRARAAAAAAAAQQAAQAQAIKELNPVEPTQNAFTRFLFGK